MDESTFRSRVADLIQRSRQAARVYSSSAKEHRERDGGKFSEIQFNEWERINKDLCNRLRVSFEHPNNRRLAHDLFSIRDLYFFESHQTETLIDIKRRGVTEAVAQGEYIRSAFLSEELVLLSARLQATQAVHQEISEIIAKARLSAPAIELSRDQMIENAADADPTEFTSADPDVWSRDIDSPDTKVAAAGGHLRRVK